MQPSSLPRFVLWFFFYCLLFVSNPHNAHAQYGADITNDPKVAITLHTPSEAFKNQSIPFVIEQSIIPNWHTYWINPGDSGEEMQVSWTLPEGVVASPLQFPAPTRIPYGPLTNFGYKDRALVVGAFGLPEGFAENSLNGTADIRWLVCEEICIPEQTSVTFSIPIAASIAQSETENGDASAPSSPMLDANPFASIYSEALEQLPIKMAWPAAMRVEPAQGNEPSFVTLDIAVPSYFAGQANINTDIDFFPISEGITLNQAPVLTRLDPQTRQLTLKIERGDMPMLNAPERFAFLLVMDNQSYQLSAEYPEAAQEEKPAAAAPNPAPLAAETQGKMTEATAATEGPQEQETAPPAPVFTEGLGIEASLKKTVAMIVPSEQAEFVFYLILAFLGGIILNLMPCVFPVLSMKALSIVKLSEYGRLSIIMNGVAYTAGILSSFAVIALGLLSLRAAGHEIGWGFQLQNPAMIIGLCWLIFAIGLNLSGAFDITIGRFGQMGDNLSRKPGAAGSFFTGLLATLVATPCTAPFMATAFGAAVTLPISFSLPIFLMLGFGLAFPYLLLCFVPALTRLLPKPGAWMDSFKQFLAFPMYATAIWLIWVATQQMGEAGLFLTLGGFLALCLAVWLLRRKPSSAPLRLVSLFIGLILAGALTWGMILLAQGRNVPFISTMKHEWAPQPISAKAEITVTEGASEDMSFRIITGELSNLPAVIPHAFSTTSLNSILEKTQRPVLVNMTASWCITCLLNERTTLNISDVKDWMRQNDVIYLKGDWTNRGEEIAQYLAEFERNGVPLYVYYPARPMGNDNASRPAPIVLPQILTPASIKKLPSLR